MSYQNAEKILPEQVLKEVQRYAAGKMLYIPCGEQSCPRRETLYQRELTERNLRIFREKEQGTSVGELARRYYLSEKSIERILRKMKQQKG